MWGGFLLSKTILQLENTVPFNMWPFLNAFSVSFCLPFFIVRSFIPLCDIRHHWVTCRPVYEQYSRPFRKPVSQIVCAAVEYFHHQ